MSEDGQEDENSGGGVAATGNHGSNSPTARRKSGSRRRGGYSCKGGGSKDTGCKDSAKQLTTSSSTSIAENPEPRSLTPETAYSSTRIGKLYEKYTRAWSALKFLPDAGRGKKSPCVLNQVLEYHRWSRHYLERLKRSGVPETDSGGSDVVSEDDNSGEEESGDDDEPAEPTLLRRRPGTDSTRGIGGHGLGNSVSPVNQTSGKASSAATGTASGWGGCVTVQDCGAVRVSATEENRFKASICPMYICDFQSGLTTVNFPGPVSYCSAVYITTIQPLEILVYYCISGTPYVEPYVDWATYIGNYLSAPDDLLLYVCHLVSTSI
ncbi:hypothetical protein K440DRAFT_642154 [Wilcoxina mikolae CBS 423.85]|nr:hypothetical protein K440DRAFT_642154 [Wilcoxina mikolae CBS 423.85]